MKSLLSSIAAGCLALGGIQTAASARPLERAYQALEQGQQETSQPPQSDTPAPEIEASGQTLVHETILHVAVSDKEGHYYKGLQKEDFEVKVNKKKCPINFFTYRENPVSFAFVFDVTGSMGQALRTKTGMNSTNFGLAKQIIMNMMKSPLSGDEFILSLVRDQQPRVVIPQFTTDVSQVQEIMNQQRPQGLTPLFDTMRETMEAIRDAKPAARNEKKAMIVVTDGEENHSKTSFKKLKSMAPELDTQIFIVIVPGTKRKYRVVCHDGNGMSYSPGADNTVDDGEGKESVDIQARKMCANARSMQGSQPSMGSMNPRAGGPGSGAGGIPMELPDESGAGPDSRLPSASGCGALTPSLESNRDFDVCDIGPEGLADATEFAETTGGLAFDTRNPKQLGEAFDAIYTHLRLQYMIGFEPKGVKKGWNKVQIGVKNPQKGGTDLKGHYVKQVYYDKKF